MRVCSRVLLVEKQKKMKELKTRLLTAWWVLIGRKCLLTAATQQTIYVREPGRDGQIVQLVTYRDCILALDNNGSIWALTELTYGSGDFQISFLMESLRRR